MSALLFRMSKDRSLFRLRENLFQIIQFLLRGASISESDRKTLNLEAGRLIRSLGINIAVTENEFDVLQQKNYVGYADYYLQECWDESELINKADVTIYKQLLEIDSKLGTTQSEQLRWCLAYSPRKDLIEV